MKILNIFVASIVIATSQILNISLSSGQTNSFSCELLSRYGLDKNASDCLENQPTNNTSSNFDINHIQDPLTIFKDGIGILTINVQGKKSSWNIKNIIKVYHGVVIASVGDGYVVFIAERGIYSGDTRLLNITRVIVNLSGRSNSDTYVNMKEGSCNVHRIVYFNATVNVDCKALDNKGNELALTGAGIVEHLK